MNRRKRKVLKICGILGVVFLTFILVFQLGIWFLQIIERDCRGSSTTESAEGESPAIDTSSFTLIYEDKSVQPSVEMYEVEGKYRNEIEEKCKYGGDIVWIKNSDRDGAPANTKTITVVDLYQKDIKAVDFEFLCNLDDSVLNKYIGEYELYYSNEIKTDDDMPNVIKKMYFVEFDKEIYEEKVEDKTFNSSLKASTTETLTRIDDIFSVEEAEVYDFPENNVTASARSVE